MLSNRLRSALVALGSAPVFFVIAGVVGFFVDAGVLHVVVTWAGVSVMGGRVVSFLSASFVTWRINRRYTFGSGIVRRGSFTEWLNYLWASGIGAVVNYSVFALLIVTCAPVAHSPTLGVAAGSVAGMIVNFTLYKLVVFRRHV